MKTPYRKMHAILIRGLMFATLTSVILSIAPWTCFGGVTVLSGNLSYQPIGVQVPGMSPQTGSIPFNDPQDIILKGNSNGIPFYGEATASASLTQNNLVGIGPDGNYYANTSFSIKGSSYFTSGGYTGGQAQVYISFGLKADTPFFLSLNATVQSTGSANAVTFVQYPGTSGYGGSISAVTGNPPVSTGPFSETNVLFQPGEYDFLIDTYAQDRALDGSNGASGSFGSFSVDLTATLAPQVPEPSTWVGCIFLVCIIIVVLFRRMPLHSFPRLTTCSSERLMAVGVCLHSTSTSP